MDDKSLKLAPCCRCEILSSTKFCWFCRKERKRIRFYHHRRPSFWIVSDPVLDTNDLDENEKRILDLEWNPYASPLSFPLVWRHMI